MSTAGYAQSGMGERKLTLFEKGERIRKTSTSPFFSKAHKFYVAQQFDSCYTYANQALSITKNKEERNYLNCILAYSAYSKGFYKKALQSLSEIEDNSSYVDTKCYLEGNVNFSLRKYGEATTSITYWLKAYSEGKTNQKRAMLHNLALCYFHQKQYPAAKTEFNKSLELIEPTDTAAILQAKMEFANLYYNQYLDDEAIQLFKESYQLANKYSDLELKQNTAYNMAIVEGNAKNYKESVRYYKELIRWKDSIWNRDRVWELTEKDKKSAVAQKQQEIALQDEKIKRHRVVQTSLIIGASGLLVFIGFLVYLYRKLKHQHELISEQKEALNLANKTKDYLFSVVSHDLRSPINTIKAKQVSLQTAITHGDLEAAKTTVDAAIAVTDSTSRLLNNVLHWSLEQSNQMLFETKEYALRPLVQHVCYDYESLLAANAISMQEHLENALVVVDKESIKIVLRNLLDNAVKYMGGAGEIHVATGIHDESTAFISVRDSGMGIAPEQLEKINALNDLTIDKINRSEGVGLGLLLCQTLVKKNLGKLLFDSEIGQGTTITILIPRSS